MIPRLSAAIVAGMLLLPDATRAQTFVAVGHDFRDSEKFSLQLGRELLGEKRRLGLRLSLEYARRDAQRAGERWVSIDSGLLTRATTFAQRSRTAGLWLSASYTPIRWYVAPYMLVSAGVEDGLQSFETPALDSITTNGVALPTMDALSAVHSSFGPAMRARVGVAVRLRKFRVFGEVTPLIFWPKGDYSFRDRSVTLGVRF
jgi:hypothetical protein